MRYYSFLVLTALIIAGCSSTPKQYFKSGLNTKFTSQPQQPFKEYIEQSERMIAKARTDINDENFEKIMDAVSPFELLPGKECAQEAAGKYKNGILLIHGFLDSPYLVKSIAKHFYSRCFLVRAILLPGHGTVPADLINTSHVEWLKATEYGVYRLRNRVDNLYIGGYSTGGALSIHSALKHRGEFKGIFLFSPAVRINSIFTPLAEKVSFYKRWLITHEDADYAKYESISMNGVAQVYEVTRKVKILLQSGKEIDTPVFMVLTLDDTTVDPWESIRFFKKSATSPKSRGYVYMVSPKKQRFGDPRLFAVNSFFPDEHIADISHVSITIPPDDPHYGKYGDYAYCIHYLENPKKLSECRQGGRDIWYGETGIMNQYKYVLRRLTFNPNYDKLIKDIDRFIDNTQ